MQAEILEILASLTQSLSAVTEKGNHHHGSLEEMRSAISGIKESLESLHRALAACAATESALVSICTALVELNNQDGSVTDLVEQSIQLNGTVAMLGTASGTLRDSRDAIIRRLLQMPLAS